MMSSFFTQSIPVSRGRLVRGKRYVLRAALNAQVKASLEQVIAPLQDEPYRKQVSLQSPELVVARFRARDEMEATLLRWLNRIIASHPVFTYSFNNFGSAPGIPLYCRLQEPGVFRQLVDQLRVLDGWLHGNGCGSMELLTVPRMVLIKSITPTVERQVVWEYGSRSFREEMSLNGLELLAETEERSEEFRLVSRFSLMPGK